MPTDDIAGDGVAGHREPGKIGKTPPRGCLGLVALIRRGARTPPGACPGSVWGIMDKGDEKGRDRA